MTDEIAERFPYKEEVTGSNLVAPTRVFQKSTIENTVRTHITRTFSRKISQIQVNVLNN